MRDGGVTVAAALSPQRTAQLWKTVVDAGVDLFVIRGTTVSAEHVSGRAEPLNLKQFIYELDVPVIVGGCATYQAALHLMRTGAAGVLVGFGGGASHTTRSVLGVAVPMASAVADVHAARRDYLDESGGRYVHVIADGGVGRSGDVVQGDRLRRRRRDDGLAAGPGDRGARPRLPLGSGGAPRASCRAASGCGSARSARWRRSSTGPSRVSDGSMNLVGALRRAMATTGYSDLKEFQRVEVVGRPTDHRRASAAAAGRGRRRRWERPAALRGARWSRSSTSSSSAAGWSGPAPRWTPPPAA